MTIGNLSVGVLADKYYQHSCIGLWRGDASSPNYTNYMDDIYLSSFIQLFDLVPATISFSDTKHYFQ